jgi:hypothetical protein
MAKYYLISIEQGATTVWLTSDGTNTGRRCRTVIPQMAAILEPESGNTTVAAGGSPFTESPLSAEGGRPFEIQIPNCPKARYDALVALKDAAGPAGEYTIAFDDGTPGDKTVTAIAHYNPQPIGFDAWGTDVVRGVQLRFITTPV